MKKIEKTLSIYKQLTGEDLDSITYVDDIVNLIPSRPYKALFELGIAGLLNQLDWSGDYSYVENALDNNEEYLLLYYPEIVQTYNVIMEDDNRFNGNVFRDTAHNYKELFDTARTLLEFDTESGVDQKTRKLLLELLTYTNIKTLYIYFEAEL